MKGDWVKLYRSALDSPILRDRTLWQVFSWCLLKANHKPTRWLGNDLDAGQFITGCLRASEELDMPKTTFQRSIRRLEALGAISQKADRKWTTITVCNFKTYQQGIETGGPQVDRARTASGHSKKNPKNERMKEVTANAVCAEPAEPDSTPANFPNFATGRNDSRTGDPIRWTLPPAKLAEYRETFPAVDVEGELRKAWQWLQDNPQRRKSSQGMPSFLTRWLNKCLDRGGASPLPRPGQYTSAVSGIDPSILPKD